MLKYTYTHKYYDENTSNYELSLRRDYDGQCTLWRLRHR
jgi:hypothetical protein